MPSGLRKPSTAPYLPTTMPSGLIAPSGVPSDPSTVPSACRVVSEATTLPVLAKELAYTALGASNAAAW